MQRSNFLKNTDLTAGMRFCTTCGIVLTSDTCLPCKVSALRRMEEKNLVIYGWENTADPGAAFTSSPGTVTSNIRTTSPVIISG
jgi:hypothetical protein